MTTPRHFNLCLLPLLALFLSVSCIKNRNTSKISKNDKLEIEKLARDIPLILSNEGWDAYEERFTQDYVNWSMVSDRARERGEFLSLVKKWYDEGNRANGSTIKSIDFIPIDENRVLYLYALQERFTQQADSIQDTSRDIRFIGIYRKENQMWKNAFTAFMDFP